jgi:hypothetical protein
MRNITSRVMAKSGSGGVFASSKLQDPDFHFKWVIKLKILKFKKGKENFFIFYFPCHG